MPPPDSNRPDLYGGQVRFPIGRAFAALPRENGAKLPSFCISQHAGREVRPMLRSPCTGGSWLFVVMPKLPPCFDHRAVVGDGNVRLDCVACTQDPCSAGSAIQQKLPGDLNSE